MESQQIWVNPSEKWAYILMLRGHEVHQFKVTGSMLTLKRNLKTVLEELEQGAAPSDVKAKSVGVLDARTLAKAEVSPGGGSLTLKGEGENTKEMTYSAANSESGE